MSVEEPSSAEQVGLSEPAPFVRLVDGQRGLRCGKVFSKRGGNYEKRCPHRLISRLSPHLAWGMSIREVYRVATLLRIIESFAAKVPGIFHLETALARSLLQKLEDQVEIEHHCMHPMFEGMRPRVGNAEYLNGKMEELESRLLMHVCVHWWLRDGSFFRMRAMVVSIACYNLWLDWREFRDWLACQFTDYEPGIHICQLQMQSGVTGINTIRMYSLQTKDLDPEGVFIKR